MDKRSQKVIFTAHCILNQNSVVAPLARAKGGFKQIINLLLEHDIGIHQISCPEFKHLGLKRTPMTKEEYNTKEYVKLCEEIASEVVNNLVEYLDNDYTIIGLLGINQSPTCSIFDEKGHLMEAIIRQLELRELYIPMFDLPEDYDTNPDEFNKMFEQHVSNYK